MNKKAFTMIELVFVIIVLGILAALALPRMERDLRQEAADNILSAIRYTQHLALNDNKHSYNDARWQRSFWGIHFTSSNAIPDANFYTVCSDDNLDGVIQKAECAFDPINGKFMFNATGATVAMDADESPNIFIGEKYGIDTINMGGGCQNNNGAKYIGFDHLGRPQTGFLASLQPNNAGYINQDCTITFNGPSINPFTIVITKETGYAFIQGQPDS